MSSSRSSSSSSPILSCPLALHPGTTLFVSLHENVTIKDARKLKSTMLKAEDCHDEDDTAAALFGGNDDNVSGWALVDARRIVAASQLIAAANMAMLRKKSNSNKIGFDTVYCAAGSTDYGKVMRDYAEFGGGADAVRSHQKVPILVLAVSTNMTINDYQRALSKIKLLPDPSPIDQFLNQQLEVSEHVARIMQWYKLTKEEVAMSSLEQAVLTRIGTKFTV